MRVLQASLIFHDALLLRHRLFAAGLHGMACSLRIAGFQAKKGPPGEAGQVRQQGYADRGCNAVFG